MGLRQEHKTPAQRVFHILFSFFYHFSIGFLNGPRRPLDERAGVYETRFTIFYHILRRILRLGVVYL
jgi:hypothetical protein